MEIILNDLLRDIKFLDIDENAKIDSEKNFIIFGSILKLIDTLVLSLTSI